MPIFKVQLVAKGGGVAAVRGLNITVRDAVSLDNAASMALAAMKSPTRWNIEYVERVA